MEADEEETRIATPPAKAAHGTPAPAKDSVAKSTPAKRTPARFTPKRAVRTPIASVEDSPKEQQAQSASPQTPGTPVPADGTPQFATSSPSAAPKSIDLSHMMQFAPKGSDSTSSDHIAAVTSAELSKVPSYLRSQFDLETLNEKLCSVNEFITTVRLYCRVCCRIYRAHHTCDSCLPSIHRLPLLTATIPVILLLPRSKFASTSLFLHPKARPSFCSW